MAKHEGRVVRENGGFVARCKCSFATDVWTYNDAAAYLRKHLLMSQGELHRAHRKAVAAAMMSPDPTATWPKAPWDSERRAGRGGNPRVRG